MPEGAGGAAAGEPAAAGPTVSSVAIPRCSPQHSAARQLRSIGILRHQSRCAAPRPMFQKSTNRLTPYVLG